MQCRLCFSDGQRRSIKLIGQGGVPKSRLLFFEGITTPEMAKDLWGAVIEVRREDLPSLPKNEFYAEDLVGLNVVDERRGGLGKIASVWKTGSNDCLEVQPEKGDTFLLPMTDEVIASVDLELKIMRVNLMPGLHPDDEA
jgi:16S rRNA processing protein RimM